MTLLSTSKLSGVVFAVFMSKQSKLYTKLLIFQGNWYSYTEPELLWTAATGTHANSCLLEPIHGLVAVWTQPNSQYLTDISNKSTAITRLKCDADQLCYLSTLFTAHSLSPASPLEVRVVQWFLEQSTVSAAFPAAHVQWPSRVLVGTGRCCLHQRIPAQLTRQQTCFNTGLPIANRRWIWRSFIEWWFSNKYKWHN